MDYPEHPLIPSLDTLTTEELSEKITELNKKLAIAYRIGNNDLCNQLRMSLNTYQTKYTQKMRTDQTGTDFNGIIDIS
jgi:hypothetical protein